MKKTTLAKQWRSLWTSVSRYYILTGGRGSGKSYAVCYFLIDLIRSEADHVVLFSRKTMTSARISIIPMFQTVLKDTGLEEEFEITSDEITHKLSGSKIWFKGLQTSSGDNTANLKSIPITTWVLDEAEELHSSTLFEKVDLSIRNPTKTNRVILILNPTTREHFIFDKFFAKTGITPGSNTNREDITTIHSTWLNNAENLSQSFIDRALEMQKKDPERYEQIMMGGWRDRAEGIILSNWSPGEYIQDNLNPLTPVFGYDDGFSPDPAALVKTHIDLKNKVLYVRELMYRNNLVETEKVNIIKQNVGRHKVYCEHSGSIIESCVRAGVHSVKAIKGPGSILKGISTLQDFELVIHPDSVNLIKEINNYTWDLKKTDTPKDEWNHLIDALRYSISDLFSRSNPVPRAQSRTTHIRPQFQ